MSLNEVKIDDTLPEIAWPTISRIQIACMAGATEDYNALYIDDDFAKSEGFGGIFAHSLFSLALFEQLLHYYQSKIQILELNATFLKLIRPGDLLTGKGKVKKVYTENKEHLANIELWVENQKHEVVARGESTILLDYSYKIKAPSKWSQAKFKEKHTKKGDQLPS